VFVNRSNRESAQRAVEKAAEAIMQKRLKLWVMARSLLVHYEKLNHE